MIDLRDTVDGEEDGFRLRVVLSECLRDRATF